MASDNAIICLGQAVTHSEHPFAYLLQEGYLCQKSPSHGIIPFISNIIGPRRFSSNEKTYKKPPCKTNLCTKAVASPLRQYNFYRDLFCILHGAGFLTTFTFICPGYTISSSMRFAISWPLSRLPPRKPCPAFYDYAYLCPPEWRSIFPLRTNLRSLRVSQGV